MAKTAFGKAALAKGVLVEAAEESTAFGSGSGPVVRATGGVRVNKAVGDAFRDEIAQMFMDAGYGVRTEVGKDTFLGRQVIDIEVASPEGQLLGGIEAKAGASPYRPGQRAKDAWLWIFEGYRVDIVRGP